MQIIAMPLPFSGSASACALTGTRTPNSGVSTSFPNSGLIPRVVRVRDERDAGRNQLGTSGFDLDGLRCRRAVGTPNVIR